MKIKLDYYKKIIDKYYELRKRNCIEDLAAYFPDIPKDVLSSIVFQEYQRKTKKTYYQHAAPHRVAEYYQQYLKELNQSNGECGFLIKIADEVGLSPALMAKLIIEYHYNTAMNQSDPNNKESFPKSKINEMLKDSSLIDDKDLAAEVKLCILTDECYGSISDVIRNSSGLEFEAKLKEDLNELGVSFIDEKQLREKGYDKTPDIKLDIPIVADGNIYNWIESKASFGDEDRHKEYLRDQYWSYCNRFGPGLVIYWLGYIEELNRYKDQGIVISDCLPKQITHMDPSRSLQKKYLKVLSD